MKIFSSKKGLGQAMIMMVALLLIIGGGAYFLGSSNNNGGSSPLAGFTNSDPAPNGGTCSDPTISPQASVSSYNAFNQGTAVTTALISYINNVKSADTSSPIDLSIINGKGSQYEIICNATGHYGYTLKGTTPCSEQVDLACPMAPVGTPTFTGYNDAGTAGGTTALSADDSASVKTVIEASNDQAVGNPDPNCNKNILFCYNYPSTTMDRAYAIGGSSEATPQGHVRLNATWDKVECWQTPVKSIQDLETAEVRSFIDSDNSNNPASGDNVNVTMYTPNLFIKKNGERTCGYESEDGVLLEPTASFNILIS